MSAPYIFSNTESAAPSVKTCLLLFAAFFTATFLVYLPTIHSKFVADAIDMVFFIPAHPSLLNISHGIRPDFVNRVVFQAWLHWFGYNAWAWHFLQCFLHSFIAVMLFAFTSIILAHFNYTQRTLISFVAAACFLVSPYHTEPIVWVGDILYLLVGSFIFIHLLALIFFLQSGEKRFALIAMLSFAAGIFTQELSWFLIPADLVIIATLAPSLRFVFTGRNFKFLLALCIIMALHLVNRAFEGELIGHYGSDVHLRIHLREIIPAFYKYILKIICFSSFTFGQHVNHIYAWMDSSTGVAVLTGVLLLSALILIWRIKKSPRIKAVICLFILFAIFVFPVLNLYFPYWIKIDADRYCYLTSAFLVTSVIIALYSLKPLLAWAFSLVYFVASAGFLFYNIESWHNAGVIMTSLETEYRWQKASRVFILNIPDDFRGAYMYRSLKNPNLFAESFIKYGKDIPREDLVIPVLGYNMNSLSDSVSILVTGKDQLSVTLSSPGSWFWRGAAGASDYEDANVEVHLGGYPPAYTVRFKQKQPGDVFLYCANGHWRQLQNF